MRLKFKNQVFQTQAVESVVNCFKGQPKSTAGIRYRIDLGTGREKALLDRFDEEGFRNSELRLSREVILENVRKNQLSQGLAPSNSLKKTDISPINLDVEMETGTGKTYCYIKTAFEMNKLYGWSKFIVVVPSIAIREGVYKTLQITADHFLESYGKRAKFFIYNSKQLHELESFSSDAGINIMIINIQAFNSIGRDNRRIYDELDDFQSRKPIDVIKANKPILILDEPQKMEGKKTLDSLVKFDPLMVLRYSATHKTQHNKVHRLDALDAYNQKLVKKISVRGIEVKGLTGTNAYLYLQSIEISTSAPVARIEIEIKQVSGIKRVTRKLRKGDSLHKISGLDQYKGFVVSEIDARVDKLSFSNGVEIGSGEVIGNVSEKALRRIQIRETIHAHFEKEKELFHKGIKVLSLFFIDTVAKYREYSEDGEQKNGEYARIFEEEYLRHIEEIKGEADDNYKSYLEQTLVSDTHKGYFSIDKKTKNLVDPQIKSRTAETDDVNAYDLILKDKERLLSFEEPTRFIFSHSALREGWDNPNVFVICTLKHSDSTISKRQEVGRGLRLSVNQKGERQDDPNTVHETNTLTVIANESYKDFVEDLQRDIMDTLSERPQEANENYFKGKIIKTKESGEVVIDGKMAKKIYKYLIKNDYIDDNDHIIEKYHEDTQKSTRAELPDELKEHKEQIFQLIDSVFTKENLPEIDNDRGKKRNPLNDNFSKKEFKELWNRINKGAVYNVYFDSQELIDKSVNALKDLKVTPLQYKIAEGEQEVEARYDDLRSGTSFMRETETRYETDTRPSHSQVKYDLIGKISESTQLKRKTIATILSKIEPTVFSQFSTSPEDFISKAITIINGQKATMIIEGLTYSVTGNEYSSEIFTDAQSNQNFSRAGGKLKKHIYDYVVADSNVEHNFAKDLDKASEVVVYAKLPKGFSIPTPVGNYNPDWAISFEEGKVKHIYFVAETKGNISSMEFRKTEKAKTKCAKKFFRVLSEKIDSNTVEYGVIETFDQLISIVK